MTGFWAGLLMALCWLPVGIAVRVVGLGVGFGVVALLKGSRLRRPAFAVGQAVDVCSAVSAAALSVLSLLAGLILGVYRMGWTPEVASGAGLLVGSLLTVVLAPIFLCILAFTTDLSPRDLDERHSMRRSVWL
jgi:hypothetical protein